MLEPIEHIARGHVAASRYCLCRFQTAALGKHGQTAEYRALSLAEQAIAPVQRGTERLLARGRRATAADQEVDAVIQAVQDLVDAEYPHSRRRELDCQWQAVQSTTDATDGGRPRGGIETRYAGLGTLHEQLDRR